jgi:hypothetical protein
VVLVQVCFNLQTAPPANPAVCVGKLQNSPGTFLIPPGAQFATLEIVHENDRRVSRNAEVVRETRGEPGTLRKGTARDHVCEIVFRLEQNIEASQAQTDQKNCSKPAGMAVRALHAGTV